MSIFDRSAFEVVTIRMATNVVDQASDLSFPLENVKQLWLIAHQTSACSANLIRLELRGPSGIRWRSAVTNLQGGDCVFLPADAVGTTYYDKSVPTPLFTDMNGTGLLNVTLTLHVTDSAGAAITHEGLVFWFAAVQSQGAERLPRAASIRDPLVMMGTRTF